jgi:hypothetical protein
MSILNILESIGSDTKRSHKLALIEQHKDNALFLKVVKMALNPYFNFYIRKIPDYDPKGGQTLDWALVELERLAERTVTGNAGIEHLRNILSSVSLDDAIVVSRIIGKDLRCGMADGTVNAVIKNYIPEYPCLLARPYDDKNIKNITYPAYSQLKADGLRANVIVKNGKVTLCGRSGRAIDLLGELDRDMLLLSEQYHTDMFYDGEFVVVDFSENIIDRKTGNGIINKAIKGTISQEEAALVRFQVWDAFPLSEFYAGKSKEDYKTRFEKLICAGTLIRSDSKFTSHVLTYGPLRFRPIPFKIVNSLEEAVTHFNELLAAGEEGTILKNFCGHWEDTRSKHLVKMKAEKSCDLEIIGYNPGEGKFVGMVGSLICASSDRLVEVSISGFSDELRQWITDNFDNLKGTIVEILYNERISSKGRGTSDSLFLPRFSSFRTDKLIADSTKEIK